jgi:glycosyltransferase involved in cell wall biosynthesis
MSDATPPTVAFILEQTLGHVTHSQNLRALVPRDERITATFCPIEYDLNGWASRVPGYSNWTVRAGVRARRAIRNSNRAHDVRALFIHTQVPAILAAGWMKRIPSVVSVDATPIQYDQLGAQYTHERGSRPAESMKWRLNRNAFARAAHLVSWSEWSKESLVADYDVPASKITVLAPGVEIANWSRPSTPGVNDSTVKILFVGGDLERKGGSVLIEAVRRLRSDLPGDGGAPNVELHLVTGATVAAEPGIVVHRGLRPNSAELIALYHDADVFCLPTLGDCLPMVLSEAGAARLPLVATDVGAIREIVQDGRTGLIVEPSSVESLVGALSRLVTDAHLRRTLGDNAAALVADRFDAAKNSARIVDVLLDIMKPSAARRAR